MILIFKSSKEKVFALKLIEGSLETCWYHVDKDVLLFGLVDFVQVHGLLEKNFVGAGQKNYQFINVENSDWRLKKKLTDASLYVKSNYSCLPK